MAGIVWTRPPSALNPAIAAYGDKVRGAVVQVALYIGANMERSAQAHAPWTDRTGNARQGLFYAVDGAGISEASGSQNLAGQESAAVSAAKDVVALYLSHSMSYGVFLELCNAGKYAIIMKTMEAHYNELVGMLRAIFR